MLAQESFQPADRRRRSVLTAPHGDHRRNDGGHMVAGIKLTGQGETRAAGGPLTNALIHVYSCH